MKLRSLALAVIIAAFAMHAEAEYHLFRFDQIYSNADGSVQYVVLREVTGANGEHLWGGHSLLSINRQGVNKSIFFPGDLRSTATANRSVLIATPGFAALGIVTPDYTMPERFIPTDGGTIDFAESVDRISLPVLPVDGASAIDRNGTPTMGTPKNFANATAAMTPGPVTSVEFYNQGLDHYFISALAPDIDALDSRRIAGWVRTGQSFPVYPSQEASPDATPVCRIIIPPPYGDSHFFGRSVDECTQTIAKFPFMSQETASAFFVNLPAAGTCPMGTAPIYRVFSNRGDANHRYTTDRGVRDEMVAKGWTAEGDGPDLVVMCAPPS